MTEMMTMMNDIRSNQNSQNSTTTNHNTTTPSSLPNVILLHKSLLGNYKPPTLHSLKPHAIHTFVIAYDYYVNFSVSVEEWGGETSVACISAWHYPVESYNC